MKSTILKLSFILLSVASFAQVGLNTQSNQGKIHVGGGFGLSFGSNSYFGFNISPYVGYSITPDLEGGITTGYQYGKSDYIQSNLFSVGPYVNYYIYESFFGRAHYEYYTGNQTLRRTNLKYNFDESALWLGGGYQSGGRVRFQVGLMYNVLYKENKSIFSSPFRPFAGVGISL